MSSTAAPIDATVRDRNTWAKRNPGAKVAALSHPKKKLTDAEKLSRKHGQTESQKRNEALGEAVKEYLIERDEKLEAMAEENHVKVSKVLDMVNSGTYYKKSRKAMLYNAKIHYMSEKVNSGLPAGHRKSLSELQELVRNDLELRSLTDEREQELIDALEEHRGGKKTSVRPNNKSASRDVLATMVHVVDELDCLFERTGWSTFVLGARGSVNDHSVPTFHAAGDSLNFIPEVLEKDPWELARLYEQWLCSREKNIAEHDTVANMRTECAGIIRTTLRNITNIKKLDMNYANYDEKIVQMFEVQLVGWPLDRFCSPSDIANTTEMRKLRNALKSGECRWKKLSSAEVETHAKEIKERRKEGEVVGKPRKRRSDAGVPRGKRSTADKENHAPPAKKQKKSLPAPSKKKSAARKTATKPSASTSRKSKIVRSREIISDEEEEDDEEDSEEDDGDES